VAEQLGKRGIAFIFTREAQGADSISPQLKKLFGGVLIANEKFTRATAQQAIAAGAADAVSWGKEFIANPDLPHRLFIDASLNAYNPETFYGAGQPDRKVGYTDYPSLAA
jgi:2,4-dienoyl-CoA reductase-like NADH-dependent reductase (Old Yellow Enzyme family)